MGALTAKKVTGVKPGTIDFSLSNDYQGENAKEKLYVPTETIHQKPFSNFEKGLPLFGLG